MTTKLTDRALAHLKARDKPYYVADSLIPGLAVRVALDGVRTWSLRYRIRGRLRRLTIVSSSTLTLADARSRAKDNLKLVSKGVDPAQVKADERTADTFEDLAKEYIAQHAKKRKRSWKEDQRMLNADILPFWKNRLARDITRRDIRDRVEAIAERAPIAANRVVALLSKIFTFALDREIIDTSPAVKITRPGTEQKRDRVLSDTEIRAFWNATEALDAPMCAFYRLRLLTAQRGVEVSTMRWEDVDLDGGWWTIPAAAAKNKLSHRVALAPTVVDLLKALPRTKATKFVLDNARGKRQQAEAAATFGIPDFKGHDLRRTAASLMAGSGTPRLVISKILNHVETGVTAVYDRHSYDAEKKIALDQWARTLDGILTKKDGKKKVVAFAAREKRA